METAKKEAHDSLHNSLILAQDQGDKSRMMLEADGIMLLDNSDMHGDDLRKSIGGAPGASEHLRE